MKKIYKLLSAVFISTGVLTSVSAQVAVNLKAPVTLKVSNNVKQSPSIVKPVVPPAAPSVTSTSGVPLWLNDAVANDYVIGGGSVGTAALYGFPIFPDSLGVFSNPTGNSIIHLVSNILDPFAANIVTAFGNDDWDKYNDYTIDSLAVEYSYQRNTDNSVIDTLVVYLYNDSNAANTPIYHIPSPPDGSLAFDCGVDTLVDTLIWKQQLYDWAHNRPSVANGTHMLTIKIPLTIADTVSSGFVRYKFFAIDSVNHTSFHVQAGGHACSAFGFIPGYSYSLNDNIDNLYNPFRLAFYQENGTASAYPSYFGTGGYVNGVKDWNVTGFATNAERYNTEYTGYYNDGYLDSLFVPEWWLSTVYETGFYPQVLQELLVQYHVTSTFNTGFAESVSPKGLTLYQNQPNPANHTTLIQYDTKTAGAVTMEIRDLTGRLIMDLNQGTQSAGSHFVTIDLSGFSQGMYLYTLRTNNESVTRRMAISE